MKTPSTSRFTKPVSDDIVLAYHKTPWEAAFEAYSQATGRPPPARYWKDYTDLTKWATMWEPVAAAAISAHFASIGARGGGKGTPAQARAARTNGLRNRKSKGKPRPVSRFADVTCEKCGCRFAVELWRGRQTVKNISTICAVCSPGSCK